MAPQLFIFNLYLDYTLGWMEPAHKHTHSIIPTMFAYQRRDLNMLMHGAVLYCSLLTVKKLCLACTHTHSQKPRDILTHTDENKNMCTHTHTRSVKRSLD